jgi:hypothetical protein
VGVCAPDGSSLVSVDDACSDRGEVCTRDAVCSAEVVETLGRTGELGYRGEGQFIGDEVAVHSDRRVIALGMNMRLSQQTTLSWAIFEASSNETYDLVYERIVRDQSSGTGAFGSGHIDYTLRAGKRYLLGVADTGNVDGKLVFAASATAWPGHRSSFGRVLGGVQLSYTNHLNVSGFRNELFDLEVATTLP